MSIFGDTHCKLSGSIELELEHSDIDPTYIVSDELEFTSALTGFRTYDNKRDYAEFLINIHLFKYADEGLDILNKILSLRDESLYFYPHSNGNVLKDITGSPLTFRITDILPYYITTDSKYDAVRLKIESTTYADLEILDILAQGYGYDYGLFYGYSGW